MHINDILLFSCCQMLDITSTFQGIGKCLAAPQMPLLKPNPVFCVLNGAYESEADLVFSLETFAVSP